VSVHYLIALRNLVKRPHLSTVEFLKNLGLLFVAEALCSAAEKRDYGGSAENRQPPFTAF
jgi:hypothetical protein